MDEMVICNRTYSMFPAGSRYFGLYLSMRDKKHYEDLCYEERKVLSEYKYLDLGGGRDERGCDYHRVRDFTQF